MIISIPLISQSEEGGFILLGLFVVFIGIWIYGQLVEKPQQIDEKKRWVSKNETLLQSQEWVSQIVNGLGNQLPPCQKCNSINFQLWEIINEELTVRCTTCKKKYKHKVNVEIKNDDTTLEVIQVFNLYIQLVQFTYKQKPTELGTYLYSFLRWDFRSLRNGTPIIRGITFNTNPNVTLKEEKYDNIPSDEPSRRISQRVKDQVWNRDSGKCVECGTKEKLEFDHIIPFSKGGSNGYRNIQLLCEQCNRKKSNIIGQTN